MKINELKHELLIELLIERVESNTLMRSLSQLNINIKRASTGAVIKPVISDEKLNRSLLKRILKLASPAELEIIATQFLSQNGFKVTKGVAKKD